MKKWHRTTIQLISSFIFLCSFVLFIYPQYKNGGNSNNESPRFSKTETITNYGVREDYYDEDGRLFAPVGTYTSIEKYLDEKGLVIEERYYLYDEPVAIAYGEYGKKYLYDDKMQQYMITYLDANGNPMLAITGYSTIKRTFYPDGRVLDEMFYDLDDKLVKIGDGQCGVRHIGNKLFKLNENGVIIWDLQTITTLFPWIAVIAGTFLSILIISLPDKKIVFAFYLIIILLLTVFRKQVYNDKGSFLFWSYKLFFTDYNLRVEILNNIWLFVPFGVGIRSIFHKRQYLIIPFLFSVCIEIAQRCFHLGLFELDDIISNTLGGCIGYMMAINIEYIFSFLGKKINKTEM